LKGQEYLAEGETYNQEYYQEYQPGDQQEQPVVAGKFILFLFILLHI